MGQGNTGTTIIVAGTDVSVSGGITTQNLNPNSGTATTGSSVAININNNQTCQVQVQGTYTGALTFQGTTDGSNWVNISVLPRGSVAGAYHQSSVFSGTTGVFASTASGFIQFRVTALGVVTGTATITIIATAAPLRVFTDQTIKNTYMIGFTGLVPAAAATDILVVSGSANKIIKIIEIELQGTSSAAITIDVRVLKRSTLNTAGTSTTLTPVPTNSNSPAASAVVKTYTANPTQGTLVGVLATQKYGVQLNTNVPSVFEQEYNYSQAERITLNNANESVCINFNGATITAGSFDGYIMFTEE